MDKPFLTDLRSVIRSIPDYPNPGIIFRDNTALLGDSRAFQAPRRASA
jgi:adenine phosphoribosyltransferase